MIGRDAEAFRWFFPIQSPATDRAVDREDSQGIPDESKTMVAYEKKGDPSMMAKNLLLIFMNAGKSFQLLKVLLIAL